MPQTPRKYPYVLLDVFTQKPLEGNQLAVFPDARGLSDAEMQALARETNLSETTFILPRDAEVERKHGIKVRIFTISEELKFAGHPTLGTAAVLREQHAKTGDTVELELGIGKIPVRFSSDEISSDNHTFDNRSSEFGEMRQSDPIFGQKHSREEIARVARLEPADLRDDVPIQTTSTGMAFVQVPVVSLEAMSRIRLSWADAAAYLEKTDAKFLYFVTRETVRPESFLHARMIFYNGEDPATGSAAGCCAAWMVRHGIAHSGERVAIEQGIEMHRPSQIYVRAEKKGEQVVNVRVGGFTVVTGRGEFTL